MRARLLISIGLLLAVVLCASPAGAETRPPPRPGGGGGAYVDGGGDPTATAHDASGSPGDARGRAAGRPQPCHWEVVVPDDGKFAIYGDDSQPQHSRTGRWLQRICDGIGAVAVGGYFLVPEGGLVNAAALAAEALASIHIAAPAIRTSPSAGGRLYVQVPTWLWLDPVWWQKYDVTASAGRVTSTVTAQPVRTSWTLGDGSVLNCVGPGRAWQPGLSDDGTDCRHTYRSSSAGRPSGTFGLKATVTLEVTWSSNISGGGTLPPISRTSTVDVRVGEIQAIGTQ